MLKGKAWKGSANTKNLLLWFILQISYISKLINFYQDVSLLFINAMSSAGFTYRLDRLKPRASKFRGPRCIVYLTLLLDFHLCSHNVLYFLNNPSVIFLTQLHSISEYCRILNTPRHLCLYWNWLKTLPSSSSREGGELGGASQVDYPRASLYLNPALAMS